MRVLQRIQAHPFVVFLIISCAAYFPVLGHKARNPDAGIILPPLFAIRNPLEYFSLLSSFEVIDFQPVRDLSFFIDIILFNTTGIVTFATTNVLLWSTGVYFFYRILRKLRPERGDSFFFATAFAAYPLFSQAICWGMARKHVLAFLLILWATDAFLEWKEGKANFLKAYVLYVLAALSHPLCILWPFWAFLYPEEAQTRERRKFLLFALTATVLLFTNYTYYTIGNKKVAEVFGHIQPDFSPAKMALNFFFYLRQLILPYELTFMNSPTFSNAWPGAIVFLALLGTAYRKRQDRRIISWLQFMLIPFPIILTLNVVFDQYLLIPAAGFVVVIFLLARRDLSLILVAATLGWGTLTFLEARTWTDSSIATLRNFTHDPSCKSASEVLVEAYTHARKAPEEALDYFYRQGCLNLREDAPVTMKISYLFIESMIMYYETGAIPYGQRIERLKELSALNYYPELVLAAIYAGEEKPEAVEAIAKKIRTLTGGAKLETGPVIDDVLRPYCQLHHLPECLKVTEPNLELLPYL